MGAAHDTPSESLTEIAYRRIKSAIMDGSLAPGFQVSEQQIAARLGVSRTPVHLAIRQLEQENWLTLAPKRGLVISNIEPSDMHKLFEALTSLEGTAVARLAGSPYPFDANLRQALEASCRDGEQSLATADLTAWAAADSTFHTLILEGCGNPWLVRLAAPLHEHAHRACLVTLRMRPIPDDANVHREIIKAIEERQPEQARALLKDHRRDTITSMLPALEALFSKQDQWMQALHAVTMGHKQSS